MLISNDVADATIGNDDDNPQELKPPKTCGHGKW